MKEITNEKIEVLSTPRLESEISMMPQEKKDKVSLIPRNVRPSAGGLWDQDNWDEFDWPSEIDCQNIDFIRGNSKNNNNDALIFSTAAKNCQIFVTEDKRFLKKARTSDQLIVLGFEKLKWWLEENCLDISMEKLLLQKKAERPHMKVSSLLDSGEPKK
ncbi:MAG: hypothetical protein B7Y39_17535 [Bdellovibrio sp. 28-41-41]|nr:MAG: hypothetical protein B7Y39_17535 [Bdellovibrio sp. 28-41-41]